MIPVRLELTNFLSYRQSTELDFNGIQLACIAGMNGAGKSTILDAMTWALFGKSRSKSDDDVVNRIAARESEEAQVIFDFELEQVIYRVIRRKKYSRTMSVEFQIASDYEAGQWKSLTKAKRRETDQAIEDVLRMNYDTFSNASFLLQGKADEFTTKTSGKRKEILADLLGVNEWDKYRDAAANRRKQEETQIVMIDGHLGEIERELAQEAVRKAEFEAAHARDKQLKQELASKETLLTQTRQTAELIEQQKKQVHSLKSSLERAERQLSSLEKNRERQQTERDGYEALLAQTAEIEQLYGQWQETDTAVRGWQDKADAFNQVQNEKRPYELTIAQTKSRLQQQQKSLQTQEQRVNTMRTERETAAKKLAETEQTVQTLTAELESFAQDEKAHQEARDQLQTVTGERNLLRQEQQQLQKQEKEVQQAQREQTQMNQSLTSATAALDQLATKLAAMDAQQQEVVQLQNQISGLDAEQPLLKEQMTQIKERMDRLDAADAEGACPLCGQPLSAEHKAAVLAELQTDGTEKGNRYRHNQTTLPTLSGRVAELEKAIKQKPTLERQEKKNQQTKTKAETRLVELSKVITAWEAGNEKRLAELSHALADETAVQALQNEISTLEAKLKGKEGIERKRQAEQRTLTRTESRMAEIDRAIQEWESTGITELSTVATQLSTDGYELEAREALVQLADKAAEVGYDAAQHEAVKQQLATLKQAPERFRQLEKAQTAVKTLDESLANLQEQITVQTAEVGERQKEATAAETALNALTTGSEVDLRTLEKEVQQLREAQIAANRQVGRAQQNLDVLATQKERHHTYTKERAERTQLITRLKRLEKACGRDGIQGLLIEYAAPEIEESANQILEKLTDGRMRVEFSTQKQLKSRDAVVETLDINIADESGVRPYENFSGGEQFRVNFAVRIALSQVLARRAGARLQTLVIDEGFGSQDPDGRSRLVEAIKTIQDDFKCILIITHIASLRDAFPTQINVYKSATGSQIAVE